MSNQYSGVWTPERIDRLREMYAQSYSAQLIADDIGGGLSRSSVMGKIRRLGLSRSNGVKGKDGRVTLGPKHVKPRGPRIIAPPIAEVEPIGVSLLDLEPGQCRFPYGQGPFTFCGCVALEKQSYCASHYLLTHKRFEVAEAA